METVTTDVFPSERLTLGRWFDAPPSTPLLLESGHAWTAAELRATVIGIAHVLGNVGNVGNVGNTGNIRGAGDGRASTAEERPLVVVIGGTDAHTALCALAVQLMGAVVAVFDDRFPDAFIADLVAGAKPAAIVARKDRLTAARSWSAVATPVFDLDRLVGGCLADFLAGRTTDPGPLESGSGPSTTLFSSGSSGEPKGVVHSHESMAEMATGLAGAVQPRPSDVFTIVHSPGYVSGCSTTTVAWRSALPVAFHDVHRQGLADFVRRLQETGSTYLRLPTALFRTLLGLSGMRDTSLRAVTVAGEAVHPHELELFRRNFPKGCVVRLTHGSTESGAAGTFTLGPGDPIPAEIRYRAQAWAELALVDPDGRDLAGPGQGEILVTNGALASGYFARPDLTAERFVVRGGRRWFRTADLGERHVDGAYSVLGRMDDRLKIRGNNVEPLVVEAALTRLTMVAAAAVVGANRPGGGTLLAAYVVAAVSPIPSSGELRRALAPTLPDYLIPSVFTFVDALPVTPGGKVDRQVLRTRTAAAAFDPHPEARPTNDTEDAVHAHVAELLGLSTVGVHDDLLDLGLDSLSLAELEARLRVGFAVPISLTQIIRSPTIAGIARELSNGTAELSTVVPLAVGDPEQLVLIVPGAGASIAYLRPLARLLSPIGTVLGAVDTSTARVHTSNARVDGRAVANDTGADDAGLIAAFAGRIVDDLVARRPRSVIVAGHSWGGVVAAEAARRLLELGHDVPLVILLDARRPGGPADGPGVGARRRRRSRFRNLSTFSAHKNRAGLPVPGSASNAGRMAMSAVGDARHERHRRAARLHEIQAVHTTALLINAAGTVAPVDPESWTPIFSHLTGCTVPGSHRDFLQEPNVAVLAETLRPWMTEAFAGSTC
jgi:acyl-coenzyme A synthetase/AMP-(fatty) acid ligase/thioesterase domain-containing protein/aryl carrier-like protein